METIGQVGSGELIKKDLVMLEKIKVAIKNGQSRHTGTIGQKTQNEDKQNKNYNTEK